MNRENRISKKPITHAEHVELLYDSRHFKLLKEFRSKAMDVMMVLDHSHLSSIVQGSVARGDISKKSDIDIFLPDTPSSFAVETSLELAGFKVVRRLIIQATPFNALKGYIEIDEGPTFSFPLVKLRQVEENFYKFTGTLSLSMLKEDVRVPGVDKRLMLIKPTQNGHIESSVIGREEAVAHFLEISLETVLDRVHALLRRDEVGRTGVFIKRELSPNETFELVLKKLADQNPAVRRRVKNSKKMI